MEELNAKVEQLGRANRNNRVLAVVGAVFCVVAMLMLLRGQIPVAAAMAAACIATFILAREMNRSYVQQATRANLEYGLCSGMENFTYAPRGGWTEEEFRKLEILPLATGKDRIMARNSFWGEKEGLTFSGSEITFHFDAEQGGTAGFHFLSGTLLTAQGKTAVGQGTLILLNQAFLEFGEVRRYLEEHYTPMPCGLANFQLYSKTGEPLEEGMLHHLKKLPDTVTVLSLTPDRAVAYLDRRFYTGAKYPAVRPTAQRLQENTLPERDEVWELFRWWLKEK